MNPPDVYRDAGLKAGRAAKVQDWLTVDSWRRWRRDARSLEKTAEALATADANWDVGYKQGRGL